jgi:hypothetical protein
VGPHEQEDEQYYVEEEDEQDYRRKKREEEHACKAADCATSLTHGRPGDSHVLFSILDSVHAPAAALL